MRSSHLKEGRTHGSKTPHPSKFVGFSFTLRLIDLTVCKLTKTLEELEFGIEELVYLDGLAVLAYGTDYQEGNPISLLRILR